MWHVWIILGIAFMIIEILTQSFFFASLTAGAFVASIVAFYAGGHAITEQVIGLSIGTLIVFLTVRPVLVRFQSKKGDNKKIGIAALIGRRVTVVEEIDNLQHTGRVKVGAEEWKACAADHRVIGIGAVVVIEKIEGVTAHVTQIAPRQEAN